MNLKDSVSVSVGIVQFDKNEDGNLYPILKEIRQIVPLKQSYNSFIFYFDYFFNSAEALSSLIVADNCPLCYGNVPAYLFLHALELKIKGTLHTIDSSKYSYVNLRQRQFGHKIILLLAELKENNVSWEKNLDQSQIDYLEGIGNDYKDKLYNYSENINHSRILNVDPFYIKRIVEIIVDNIDTELED